MNHFWIWFFFTVGSAIAVWFGGCSWNSFFAVTGSSAFVLFVHAFFGEGA